MKYSKVVVKKREILRFIFMQTAIIWERGGYKEVERKKRGSLVKQSQGKMVGGIFT